MKKRYVRPAVSIYKVEAQQQMLAGSVSNRPDYDDGSDDWDQSDIGGRPDYGDGSPWSQD
jgi:hypothetical protein